MFAVLVRCYDHWFIPYEPGSKTRQCVYRDERKAEELAELLRTKKERGKKVFEEVSLMKVAG